MSPLARLTVVGSTLDGRPLDLLTIGTGPLQVWVLARQHPGEPMAEWLVEGMLDDLLHGDNKKVLDPGLRATGWGWGWGLANNGLFPKDGCER